MNSRIEVCRNRFIITTTESPDFTVGIVEIRDRTTGQSLIIDMTTERGIEKRNQS